MKSRFGKSWDRLREPIEAKVSTIDSHGHNPEFYMIGLTAMQLSNLGIERYIDSESGLDLLVNHTKTGMPPMEQFEKAVVEYNGRNVEVHVYNTGSIRDKTFIDAITLSKVGIWFSQFRSKDGIRVSQMLAEELGLNQGDKVLLYKVVLEH